MFFLHIIPQKQYDILHGTPIFLADGIIVKLPGKVLPDGVQIAITNNSFFCRLVPLANCITLDVRS
jgi:hypothetical protein